jgi:hypothetical protein
VENENDTLRKGTNGKLCTMCDEERRLQVNEVSKEQLEEAF